MGRLLLTQSQVSLALSLGVILFFSVVLFLSGYVAQQRTVKGLQTALQPRIPRPPALMSAQEETHQSELQYPRLFGRNSGHVAYTNFDRDVHEAGVNIDWNRLAHIQLVRSHRDVCSAIMVLAELHWQKSPARRVLLFPKIWAEEKRSEKGDVSDPYLDSTRRLLKLAARRYKVELRPVVPIHQHGESDTYSLASAFSLHEFDRVLTIETPGLLLEAEPLDAILGFTQGQPFAMLHDTHINDGVHSEDLFLFEPSKDMYTHLTERLSAEEAAGYNDSHFSTLFQDPALLASSNENSALIRSVGVLHDVGKAFNQTAYLSDVAYIRFSDPKLPGPEYELQWADKLAARPRNKDADWTWTKLYGDFAQKRMDICGLDLESWRP